VSCPTTNAKNLIGCKWTYKLKKNSDGSMWLIIHKKLNTIELLKRKNLSLLDNCAFCRQGEEDIAHIYFECPITELILSCTLHLFCFSFPSKIPNRDFFWNSLRPQLGRASRYPFDTLFTIICWYIWYDRNQRVFQRVNTHHSFTIAAIAFFFLSWISNLKYKLHKNRHFHLYLQDVSFRVHSFSRSNGNGHLDIAFFSETSQARPSSPIPLISI